MLENLLVLILGMFLMLVIEVLVMCYMTTYNKSYELVMDENTSILVTPVTIE